MLKAANAFVFLDSLVTGDFIELYKAAITAYASGYVLHQAYLASWGSDKVPA